MRLGSGRCGNLLGILEAKAERVKEDVDSDYLFGNCPSSPFRYNPCLPPAGHSLPNFGMDESPWLPNILYGAATTEDG